MLESLKITSTTAGNVVLEERIVAARTLVSEGGNLTDALREKAQFPVFFAFWVLFLILFDLLSCENYPCRLSLCSLKLLHQTEDRQVHGNNDRSD